MEPKSLEYIELDQSPTQPHLRGWGRQSKWTVLEINDVVQGGGCVSSDASGASAVIAVKSSLRACVSSAPASHCSAMRRGYTVRRCAGPW
ncbi:hypothetical protein B0H10DRAFT_2068903, partial [Mycena sp. CBHHK59/15]